ncbi:MAG TPA: hypothetical protein VF447_05290 [Terriglobales bacterium]
MEVGKDGRHGGFPNHARLGNALLLRESGQPTLDLGVMVRLPAADDLLKPVINDANEHYFVRYAVLSHTRLPSMREFGRNHF